MIKSRKTLWKGTGKPLKETGRKILEVDSWQTGMCKPVKNRNYMNNTFLDVAMETIKPCFWRAMYESFDTQAECTKSVTPVHLSGLQEPTQIPRH